MGLINALGYRGDAASAAALTPLLRDNDRAAAAAAANALGKIGGPAATAALKTAWPKAPEALKSGFADAYLRCADKLLAQGKTREAMAVYDELLAADAPQAIRIAAVKGKLTAAGKKD